MHEFTPYEPCTANCPPMMPYTSHDKQQCYKALTTCFTNNTYWDTPSDQPTNVPNTEMMKCNKQKVFSLEQRRQNMEKRRRKMENDPRKVSKCDFFIVLYVAKNCSLIDLMNLCKT